MDQGLAQRTVHLHADLDVIARSFGALDDDEAVDLPGRGADERQQHLEALWRA